MIDICIQHPNELADQSIASPSTSRRYKKLTVEEGQSNSLALEMPQTRRKRPDIAKPENYTEREANL